MRLTFLLLGLLGLLGLWACQTPGSQSPSSAAPADSVLTLDNGQLAVKLHLHGGAFVDLQVPGAEVNPVSWGLTKEQMPPNNLSGPPFRGHFLCLGRWGQPSPGEMATGIPHNGEHNTLWWQVKEEQELAVHTEVTAPKDGYYVSRMVRMEPEAPVFHVLETVRNNLKTGRLFNYVQHPTLGPPFLSPVTVVNTNAGPGFLQTLSYPDPHAYEYRWPAGIRDTTGTEAAQLDLRRSDVGYNYVSTHIFDRDVEHGWITAYSPEFDLVYGFIWNRSDYPWLNVWHHEVGGEPVAKGLEFGTTGIGRSYPELLLTDTRFHGYQSFEFLDAATTVRKGYSCFLLPVEPGLEQVTDVRWEGQEIVLTGEDGKAYRMAGGKKF